MVGARTTLYYYVGLGAKETSVGALRDCLTGICVGTKYTPAPISPQQITNSDWEKHAALLAVGGGWDRGFLQALGESGTAQIRRYVESGGAYLGICAGAYFACDHIDFDKNGLLEVCGNRPLNFFNGNCVGPVFPGFDYDSEAGADAPLTTWQLPNLTLPQSSRTSELSPTSELVLNCYFNGGGMFLPWPTEQSCCPVPRSYTPLATYTSTPGSPLAAVLCSVGAGRALLSGVHMEYNPSHVTQTDPQLGEHVVPALTQSEPTRQQLVSNILRLLAIT